jgi:hypothetical protein
MPVSQEIRAIIAFVLKAKKMPNTLILLRDKIMIIPSKALLNNMLLYFDKAILSPSISQKELKQCPILFCSKDYATPVWERN